ncbi:ankyrin repeat domain-containing protein [Acerihabitans sp. KWT182]|uniref:Ankyrin repeat domain-containing protein n=1 Tax=Acerihabitans sp. KWT182 TaxID=3157919 RepID=A0AAU7QBB5_9GAMM
MDRLTSECSTYHAAFKEVNEKEASQTINFCQKLKKVRSTEINIDHLPPLVVSKIFKYLSNEQLLMSALFSDMFANEARRVIKGRKKIEERNFILNLDQENVSQCIKSLSALFEYAGDKIDTKTGNTILHDAISERKTYLVKDLLTLKRLDINISNKENFTAFALAAYDGQIEVVDMLLDAPNVIINIGNGKYNQSALQLATIQGNCKIVKKIIDSGLCDINKQDNEGTTALHFAAKRGYVKIVQLLLERQDINVNCAHEDGDTPLMVALGEKKYDVARALMARHDINIRTKNKLGYTPLHIATMYKQGDESIINTLLVKGLNVNDKTEDGFTPLDIAFIQNSKVGVEALLRHPQVKAGLSKDCIEDLQLEAYIKGHPEIGMLFEPLSGKNC